MITEYFAEELEYLTRLRELGDIILSHGYNEGTFWIRYQVKRLILERSEWLD